MPSPQTSDELEVWGLSLKTKSPATGKVAGDLRISMFKENYFSLASASAMRRTLSRSFSSLVA